MESPPVTYYSEIALMMFGFGDSHKPNPDTVRLVEATVLNQLRAIVQAATQYCTNTTVSGEQLVFLMRANRTKMRRFVKYLHKKELSKSMRNVHVVEIEDEYDGGDTTNAKRKLKNKLLAFIERIDETGELTDIDEFDEVKHARQLTASRISEALDETKYLEFQGARCVSFTSSTFTKSFERLRRWVDPERQLTYTDSAVDVLAYYAYETVAQLMDYALLIRADARRGAGPERAVGGGCFTASMFNGRHRFGEAKPDYSRVYSGQAPISVAEIREVLRRVWMPQVGRVHRGRRRAQTQFIIAL